MIRFNSQNQRSSNAINFRSNHCNPLDQLLSKSAESGLLESYKSGLPEKITNLSQKNRPIVIGITGASGVGKSCLSDAAIEYCATKGVNVPVLPRDRYIKDYSHHIKKHGSYQGFLAAGGDLDSPEATNLEQIKKDLDKLLKGKPVFLPFRERETGIVTSSLDKLKPAQIILIEGISIFHEKIDNIDLKIFMDAPMSTIKKRWGKRAKQRGKVGAFAKLAWQNAKKGYEKHILPRKNEADIIFNAQKPLQDSASLVKSIIKNFL